MRGGAGGEIVEVEGGHIVRSTGRKDRHSKVCTSKGPRDRRVRLSAHTAIQFYDVQDRLGYDRPSKAVDWLIKKAKTAIDELAKLPPWNPIATVTTTTKSNNNNPNAHHNEEEEEEETDNPICRRVMTADGGSPSRPTAGNGDGINVDLEGGGGGGSGFFSPSLEVDIADTISSFLPTKTTSSLPIRFQSYTPDLLSRTSNNNNNQDLRLSLQSLQDPILFHQHQAQNHHQHHHHQNQNEQVLFPGTTALGFDGMVAWNAGNDTGGHGSGDGGGICGGGFVFNTPSPSPVTAPALLFGQSQYLSQRGPLQSSNNPSIRAWIDAPSITAATATTVADHHHHHVLHHYLSPAMMHQSVPGIGFASGGFSGFRVPARIQGEDEEHDVVSDKPSSVSSDSRH